MSKKERDGKIVEVVRYEEDFVSHIEEGEEALPPSSEDVDVGIRLKDTGGGVQERKFPGGDGLDKTLDEFGEKYLGGLIGKDAKGLYEERRGYMRLAKLNPPESEN